MAALTLEIVEGPGAGRQLPFAATTEIGRDPAAQMRVNDPLVSRRHARLVAHPEGAVIEDLGSKNGTFVNGEQIYAPTRVRGGDTVLVGTTVIELRTDDDVRARASAVRPAPPALAVAARRPDYVPESMEGALRRSPTPAGGRPIPELDPLLDVYTKAKARTAPLAIFALAVIALILFLALVVRR